MALSRQDVPFVYVPDFLASSERGRSLLARFAERHEEVVRDYLAEAALYEGLRLKSLHAASYPDQDVELSPAEQRLLSGDTVSEKYRSDSY